MLISCPKCHCIYEVPDEIIKKTGTNLRCHTCGNVWHAMPEDALDYHAEEEDTPYIEPIEVDEPSSRNFPADKKDYTAPIATKSSENKKTAPSSAKAKASTEQQEQITLTSDFGTSFTISASPELVPEDENKKTPWLAHDENEIRPQAEDRLRPEKSCRSYTFSCIFCIILLLALLTIFFRRDIVTIYPKSEDWYNQIHLSGMNNAEYLRFEKVNISSEVIDNKLQNRIKAEIVNTSRYNTIVPQISISGINETFQTDRTMIKAHEKAYLDIVLPLSEQQDNQGLTLSFVRP